MEQSTAEVPKEESTEPVQDGSIQSAASVLSGLLTENATTKESVEDAPPGQAASPVEVPAQEASEPKPADEAKAQAAAIALKIGEKEYNIPVTEDMPEEVRTLVKDGLLMRADYTRKTQEVAEQRKAIEVHQQQIGAAIQAVQALPQQMAAIQSVEAQLQQFHNPELWQRLESDPLGKIEAKQAYQDLLNQRQFLHGKLNVDRQNLSAWQAQQAEEHAKAELPKVKASIPDFGPEKAKAIVEYAKSQGYTPQQMQAISYSAPLLIAVNKAMEFDKLQGQKSAATQKVEKLPPVTQKAGVGKTPGTGPSVNQSAMSRLERGGKVEDAAAVFKSLGF